MIVTDLRGQRFGRLTVCEEAGRTAKGNVLWLCSCDCGTTKTVSSSNLVQGHTRSCGCLHREQNIKHGLTNSKLYSVWTNIKTRCNNPKNRAYPHYGGRGISLCDEWSDFSEFNRWALENGYECGLTLDRICVDGPYSPDNCRWTSMKTQQNNRRNNRYIEFDGQKKTLSEWSDQTGIGSSTLRTRLEFLHWPIERALTEPVRGRSK